MAESKRVYEIRINGIQESYEGVKSLREALDGLTDTVINVSNEEKKTSETRKSTASSTDALAKAQEKLNSYDRAYQEELAKVNAELSANKKEINDALKLQQAQDVVDAKQLDTYAQKQQYLSALNTLIRNHSTATEEDTQSIDRMVQESAALQAELKATDETMKIYVRNVGNYNEAADRVVDGHKSIKQELKELKTEMADMLANGVSKTDEGYLKLAERAGQLKDALGDANQDIANFASDTRGLSNAINLASSAVNAYQLYNSTMELFGAGNEEAAESMKKMMAVMTVLNSLQQVQNSLLENGSATARLYHKAVELIQAALGIKKTAVEADTAATEANAAANEANIVSQEANAAANEASAVAEGVETAAKEANTVATGTNSGALGTNTGALGANAAANQAAATATNTMSVAQKAGAVASKTLSVALRAIPLMAIIGLVMALIQNWQSIWNWFKKTFPILDTLSKKFNKLGGWMNAIVTGAKAVAAAVVNWLINPFKTFANVIGKILEGDFAGAWQAALDGVKNQFKGTIDAFNNEVVKGYARGQEQMTQKNAEENVKRWEHDLKMMKNKKNADGTYSKEYLDMQEKIFEEKKKMYKKDSDEYRKVEEEQVAFHEQNEERMTKASEKAAKARTAAANKAAKDAQKAAEEYEKRIEKLIADTQKLIEQSDKIISDSNKSINKNEAETKKLVQNQTIYYKNELEKRNYELQSLIKKEKEALEKAEEEHNAWVAGLELTGADDDLAQEKVKKLQKSIDESRAKLSIYNAELEANEEKIKKYIATAGAAFDKRKELMVQSLAEEGIALQKTYQKALDEVVKQMADVEDELEKVPKKDKERIKKLNDDLDELKKRHNGLLKSMEEQLGEYANKEIKIPVDIDTVGITERYYQLLEELEKKKIPIRFNELEVTDMILGFGRTFEDVFDRVAKYDALTEITKQLGYWGKQAKLTKEEIADATLILNSGLPLEQIEDMLLQLSDKFGQTKESMREVFDYAEKSALKGQTLIDTFMNIGRVAGLSDEKLKELEETLKKGLNVEEAGKAIIDILSNGQVNLKKFGDLASATKRNINDANKELSDQIRKTWTDLIAASDKSINDVMLNIKRFQETTKETKFEPVMDNDALTKYFGGQILNIEQTKERYSTLKGAYETYLESIKEGGAAMQIIEQSWQQKLDATEKLYTKDSYEYRKAVEDKRQALNVFKVERENATNKIKEITDKEGQITRDYYESIEKQMKSFYSQLSENVFEPLADGFGALLEFQLEELQEALDEIEDMLDKAVEDRENSAERMKEINAELREDDGQNKEALQQRLAEEEVLLVQREEAERALEKEREKRKRAVERKEAQQRVLELTQKLAEGIANTAVGVTAALKYGPILGPIFAAIIGAMGAVQTGIILKQIDKAKSKLEYGGKVGEDGVSRSHKQGGHRIEGTNIEVEGHEWVINKKSSDKYDGLLRAINDDNAGMIRRQIEIIRERRIVHTSPINKFADGGRINTLAATNAVRENNEIAALTELVKQIDFEPVVSVVDINKTQKRLVRVKEFAGSVS